MARRSRASLISGGSVAALARSVSVGANGARKCCMAASARRSGSNGRNKTRLPAAKATSRTPAPNAASGVAPPRRFASTIPNIAGANAAASRSVEISCTPELQATISAGRATAPCASAVVGLISERRNQKTARPNRVSGLLTPRNRFTDAGVSSSRASSTPRSASGCSIDSSARAVPSGCCNTRAWLTCKRESCVATRSATPRAARLAKSALTRAAASSSRPSVGSSAISRSGSAAAVTTSARRRRSPSEQRAAERSNRSATLSAAATSAARPRSANDKS